jgi:hypothetical protein
MLAVADTPTALLQIVSALGLVVALGLEWTSLRQLRHATTAEHLREWLRVSKGVSRVHMPSMAIVLVSGVTLMATVWGGAAWIIVTLGPLVLLSVIAMALSGPRMAAIERAVTAEHGRCLPLRARCCTTRSYGSLSRPERLSPWALSFS